MEEEQNWMTCHPTSKYANTIRKIAYWGKDQRI